MRLRAVNLSFHQSNMKDCSVTLVSEFNWYICSRVYTLIKKLSEEMASHSLQHTAGSTPHRCPLQDVFGQVSWDSPHHMCWQLNLHVRNSLCDWLSYRSKAEFFPLSTTTSCLHSKLYPRLNTIIHKLWSTPQKQVTKSWADATRLRGVTEIHLCMPWSFKLHQASKQSSLFQYEEILVSNHITALISSDFSNPHCSTFS